MKSLLVKVIAFFLLSSLIGIYYYRAFMDKYIVYEGVVKNVNIVDWEGNKLEVTRILYFDEKINKQMEVTKKFSIGSNIRINDTFNVYVSKYDAKEYRVGNKYFLIGEDVFPTVLIIYIISVLLFKYKNYNN